MATPPMSERKPLLCLVAADVLWLAVAIAVLSGCLTWVRRAQSQNRPAAVETHDVIDLATALKLLRAPNVLWLDLRERAPFHRRHLEVAEHLPFSQVFRGEIPTQLATRLQETARIVVFSGTGDVSLQRRAKTALHRYNRNILLFPGDFSEVASFQARNAMHAAPP